MVQISGGGGTAHLLEQVDDHHQMTQEGMRIFVRECSSRHKCFWGRGEGCTAPTSEGAWQEGPWTRGSARCATTYTTVNVAGKLGEDLVLFGLWENDRNVSDFPR